MSFSDFALLLTASPHAEATAHHASAAMPSLGLWATLWQANVPNLLLVLVVLGFALSKANLGAALKQQAQAIAHDIEDSEQLIHMAQLQQRDSENEVAQLIKRKQTLQAEAEVTLALYEEQAQQQQQALEQQWSAQLKRQRQQNQQLHQQWAQRQLANQLVDTLQTDLLNQLSPEVHKAYLNLGQQALADVSTLPLSPAAQPWSA
jgi:F0F1-type ATP synthase membrane subunit b/b'